jgi:UDP-N-acetylmuramate--alanine ligase
MARLVTGGDSVAALREQLRDPGGARVHLLGIGGVGMAGLAAFLQQRGFAVDGCDVVDNRLIRHLVRRGVPVAFGHDPAHLLPTPAFAVRSTAVAAAHPECVRARERDIPLYSRGEVFAALLRDEFTVAICGTHGKTTTTAMATHVVRADGNAPSFFIGGEWEADGRVYERGTHRAMIVEADESDGTLRHYAPDMLLITGIDYDHMEHFKSENDFVDVFRRCIRQTRGPVVYCGDDPLLVELIARCQVEQAWSYGLAPHCRMRAEELALMPEVSRFRVREADTDLGVATLSVPGKYNIVNALGALTVARLLAVSMPTAMASLSDFIPVRRRFEYLGEWMEASVFSDYAHHPTEISVLIAAARHRAPRRLIAIFQPHRFTRTRALGPLFPAAFVGVDHVILAPVYAASETALAGGELSDLVDHFARSNRCPFSVATSLDAAWRQLSAIVEPGDLVVLVGAGDVDQLGKRCVRK